MPACSAHWHQSSRSTSKSRWMKRLASGGRHARGHGAVGLAVAGGGDGPALRQGVLAEPAVEHELVAGGLDQGRCGVELVQEQHALAVAGQELGRGPVGPAIAVDVGQAAQVDGVEQDGPDVDQPAAQFAGDLGDDVGLADAGLAPEEGGPLGEDQRTQRRCDVGGFHEEDSLAVRLAASPRGEGRRWRPAPGRGPAGRRSGDPLSRPWRGSPLHGPSLTLGRTARRACPGHRPERLPGSSGGRVAGRRRRAAGWR